MIFRKAFLFAALTLAAGTSQAWTLVYATDASGNVSAGSLQSLRTAINNGADVKVLVTSPNIHVWGVPCTNTSVKLDSQAVVCIGSMMGLAVNAGVNSQFGNITSPTQSANFLMNTSGQYAQSNINIVTGEVVFHSVLVYPMEWYVN